MQTLSIFLYNSAYRSPEFNKKEGGPPNSNHNRRKMSSYTPKLGN